MESGVPAGWLVDGPRHAARAGARAAVAAAPADPTRQQAPARDTRSTAPPGRRLRSCTPGTAEAAAISASVSSRARTTRAAPSSPAAATSALLAMQVCVLKWNSSSGILRPQGQQGRVADQHRVGAALPGQLEDPRRLAQLPLGQVDVERQVRPCPVGVAAARPGRTPPGRKLRARRRALRVVRPK